MQDPKIRLNEIVSPKEIKYKQQGPLHILNNSIRRNTLFDQTSDFYEPLTYDCKLPQLKMSTKGISNMLKYLLTKEEMSLPDRNLVRRIMLDTFDQDFIESGSKDFIKHLKMFEEKQNSRLKPKEKLFYMVLKGSVIVKACDLHYCKNSGQTFGELELLAGIEIDQINFQSDTIIVTLTELEFQRYFYNKFYEKYTEIYIQLGSLRQWLDEIPLFCKFMFLSKINRKFYQFGEKIVERGDALQKIYIVGDKLKEQGLKHVSKGCIGLYELRKKRQCFQETVYSPCSELMIMEVETPFFQLYVMDFLHHRRQMNASSILMKSQIKANLTDNPELKQKISNFMHTKKVRLSMCKRAKTQTNIPVDHQFKFLKLGSLPSTLSPIKQQQPAKKVNFRTRVSIVRDYNSKTSKVN